jgi:transketolase
LVLIGAGSEVWPCLEAAKLLAAEGIQARVVSFPSWKLFEEQTAEYKASVLPAGVPKLAVEAGVDAGLVEVCGPGRRRDRPGPLWRLAPGPKVLAELGFSAAEHCGAG